MALFNTGLREYQFWFDTLLLAFSNLRIALSLTHSWPRTRVGNCTLPNSLAFSPLTVTPSSHFNTSLTLLQPHNTFPFNRQLCHSDHMERRKVHKCHGLFLSCHRDIRRVYVVAMKHYETRWILRLSLEVRAQGRAVLWTHNLGIQSICVLQAGWITEMCRLCSGDFLLMALNPWFPSNLPLPLSLVGPCLKGDVTK